MVISHREAVTAPNRLLDKLAARLRVTVYHRTKDFVLYKQRVQTNGTNTPRTFPDYLTIRGIRNMTAHQSIRTFFLQTHGAHWKTPEDTALRHHAAASGSPSRNHDSATMSIVNHLISLSVWKKRTSLTDTVVRKLLAVSFCVEYQPPARLPCAVCSLPIMSDLLPQLD